MAFSDLLHGEDNTLEHNTHLETNITLKRRCPPLFDTLKQHGYRTAGMGYPKEGANKRGNSSRLTQSFHFFMFEPIFSPVNALNQPI
jgi:arylsulfatase A-like enzyme